MQKKNRRRVDLELAADAIHGNPETAFEMVNKYGTYEIQPTADTENPFPTIAQGRSVYEEKPTKAADGVASVQPRPADKPK